jgi:hypothetical protein
MSDDDRSGGAAGPGRARRPEPPTEYLRLYAQTPSVQVSIEVAATPEAIWPLVTDINLPAGFSEEFQGASWLDTPPGLGARFVGRSAHPARGQWETTSTVTRFEPGRAFEWTVGSVDVPSSIWRFEIAPTSGGSHLTQWARMGPAPSGLTPAIERMPDKERRIVARRLEEWIANMTANLQGIKALAEAGA